MTEKEHIKRVGREIAALRKRAGLSQGELAEKSGTFWTTISRIENGRTSASLEVLVRLASALDADIRDLFGSALGTAAKDELINDILRELRPRNNHELEMVRDILRRVFSTYRAAG